MTETHRKRQRHRGLAAQIHVDITRHTERKTGTLRNTEKCTEAGRGTGTKLGFREADFNPNKSEL